MRIIYFGNNIRGIKCLQALWDEKFTIVAVVVHHKAVDQPVKNSVFQLAKNLSIPVYQPKNPNDSDFLEILKQLNPDLMVLSGYNPFLKKKILSIPTKGTINLHGGRLPDYRGGSPINWQIINGEQSGTCSITFVVEKIDAGDILAQEEYRIGVDQTAGDIIAKTLDIFPAKLVEVVRGISENSVNVIKQDDSKAKYFCKRHPKDGQIFWRLMSAQEIHNLARGLNGPSLPGAFTFLNGKKIVIWKTQLMTDCVMGVPGRVALMDPNGVVVIAKDKGILIKELMLEDEDKILKAVDYFKICGWTFD